MELEIYVPFQHSILSPHPLKHFPHHLMFQGRTSEKRNVKDKYACLSRHKTALKAHHSKTTKQVMLVVELEIRIQSWSMAQAILFLYERGEKGGEMNKMQIHRCRR